MQVEDPVIVVGVPDRRVGFRAAGIEDVHGAIVAAMTVWEYQVAPIPLHNETLMLNNFGQDGWELVTILRNEQGGLVAFLKRAKAS